MPRGYVYIMSNINHTVLYIGVTTNIGQRAMQHKRHEGSDFTMKFSCTCLVYYEEHHDIRYAIGRETQMKRWKREWKDALINEQNPEWADLAADW